MDNGVIYEIARSNVEMSDVDRLVNIYWALSSVLVAGVPGDVAEVGCNAGKTSVFLQMLIQNFDRSRHLHLFDSFEGLPAPGAEDAYLQEGDCRATIENVVAQFEKWGQPLPNIHKGWFEDTLPRHCPEQVSFAYLDGDFYQSILTSLEYIYPRLPKNGIILIDDYGDKSKNPLAWDELPGVKLACDHFFSGKPETVSVLVGTGDLPLGLVRKL